MLKRNLDTLEISCSLSDIISDIVCNYKDNTNYIHEFLMSLLNIKNKERFRKNNFDFFVEQIVCESERKRYEDSKRVNEIVKSVINISETLSKNPAFIENIQNIIKQDDFFKEIREEFVNTGKSMLSMLSEYDEDGSLKHYMLDGEKFFASSISKITPEFYYILEKANILLLISRYNKNDKYLKLDLKFGIINPLCALIQELLVEEKARFLDLYIKLREKRISVGVVVGKMFI